MKKIIILFFIIELFGLIRQPKDTWAAGQTEISILPVSAEITAGDSIILDLVLKTGGEKIYSLSLQLGYPADKLAVAEFRNQDSLVTDWVKQETKPGLITLTGGIQKGFVGQGKIASLKLISKSAGETSITFLGNNLILDQNQQNQFSGGSTTSIKIKPSASSPSNPPPPAGGSPTPPSKILNQKNLLIVLLVLAVLAVVIVSILLRRKSNWQKVLNQTPPPPPAGGSPIPPMEKTPPPPVNSPPQSPQTP